MGLFDKKYCDICGEKIGLLGNRKLEDGNLCKDCAKKLSPFFSDRRHSTVAEIKEQLAYREENERRLADFHPDMTFGESRKVYVDRSGAQFIVTSASNWRNVNPDLIQFGNVKNITTDIHESKNEIYYKDSEGNRKSYNPRRYECDYAFNVTIMVDSPWFDKIELELSDGNRPDSPYTDLYRKYEEQMHTLVSTLSRRDSAPAAGASAAPKTREQEIMENVLKEKTWMCTSCNFPNYGTLTCKNCGAALADEKLIGLARDIAKATIMMEGAPTAQSSTSDGWKCEFCGSQNQGKFCENCGAAKPQAD